jgi:hypothetical protein
VNVNRFGVRLAISLVGLLLSLALPAEPAGAYCTDNGEPLVHWTYPGDAVAPPAPQVYLLSNHQTSVSAAIDGVPLAASSADPGGRVRAFDGGGPLSPGVHTLEITFPGVGGAGPQLVSHSFTVEASAVPPSAPEIVVDNAVFERVGCCDDLVLKDNLGPISPECMEIVQQSGCHHVFPVNAVRVDATSPTAVLWTAYVGSTHRLWPAACGPPRFYSIGGNDDCFTLTAFDPQGRSASTEICASAFAPAPVPDGDADATPDAEAAAPEVEAPAASSSGCAGGPTPLDPWGALALAALLWTRRRGL